MLQSFLVSSRAHSSCGMMCPLPWFSPDDTAGGPSKIALVSWTTVTAFHKVGRMLDCHLSGTNTNDYIIIHMIKLFSVLARLICLP